MHTSRCNDTSAFSPISRRAQRSESTTMTNLLTPNGCNSSILSSTCNTPLRKAPKYSLSRPMSTGVAKSTSSNIHFNSNSIFYTPSKVEKSPLLNNTVIDLTSTHQAKYGRPGLFPVVHVFQKKLPIITPKQNSCVIKLSSNGPGLFDDSLSYESLSITNSTPSTSEPSTRSVLDALKEISRKRIHTTDSFDIEKEKTSEYSKRNREEDTSISPKTGQISPKQAPKRICVVDPIYASNTSSFCLKNNKRKLYECWLPTNENKNKKVMSVETQTLTFAPDDIKDAKETPQESAAKSTLSSETKNAEILKSTVDNESDKTKKCLLDIDEQDDDVSETAASAQRAWDEKIYAIQKKNKLALVLSRISGEEPKLIPVPRLWDKTNDVSDTSTNDKASKLTNEIIVTSLGPPIIGDSLINVSLNLCSTNGTTSTITTSPSTSKATTAVTSVTSFTTPVSSTSNEAPVLKVTQVLLPTKESSSVVSLSTTTGSVTSVFTTSTFSSTGFAYGTAKPTNTEVTSTTTNGLTSTLAPSPTMKTPAITQEANKSSLPLDGLGKEDKDGGSVIPVGLQSGNVNLPASSMPVSNQTHILPAKSTSSSTTTLAFTPSTLLEPVHTSSSTSLAWTNQALQSKPQTFTANGGLSSNSKTQIAFGVTGNPVFGSLSKPDAVSFETAFGLKPSSAPAQKSSSNNTEFTPNTTTSFNTTVSSVTSIASGGFSFMKPDESKPAPSTSTTGSIFGSETRALNTPVTTITTGFATSALSANKTQANSIFGSNTSNPTFGSTSTAGQKQSPSFPNQMTSSTTKMLGGGFAITPVCGTSTSLAFGTSKSKFGSVPTSSSGCGSAANTTTTTTFGGIGSVSATTQKPSVLGIAALDGKSTFNKSSTSTSADSGAFTFSSSNLPSYAASIGTNAVTSSSNRFGNSVSNTASITSSFGFGISAAAQPTTGFTNANNNANSTGFGTTTSTFGVSPNNPAVFSFGNNKSITGFGTPSAAGAGFNSGNAGVVASTGSGSAFGQSASATGDGVFGFGSNTTTTNSAFAFGGSIAATTTTSFGSNSFGSFGSTATSQSSGFGSAPNVNPFGKSSVSSFGGTSTASPGTSVFGASGSQTTIGFGAAPSTFNATAPIGNTPSFGSSATPLNFNSSFGSVPAAGSASFSFGSSSAPGFGSNNQAFGNNSSGFSFKAPGADGQKAVFAFGSSEQSKAASGGFNFVAGGVQSPASNFSASFGAASVQQPGTFNIGSGVSSNPGAKRAQLRAKRRT